MELRAEHHVACLSNTNSVHWARFPELAQLFDSMFLSHLTGFVKPDPDAYNTVLKTLGVEPGDVYFFDDMRPNVNAAKAIGMNAFHVRGFAEIAPVLSAQGLYKRKSI